MASLSITVPDIVVPRILAALSANNAGDVQAWIKAQIKAQVANYEASQIVSKASKDSVTKEQAVQQEVW